MALGLKVCPLVRRKLARWSLDEQYDGLLADAYLFLEDVKADPFSFLLRLTKPFNGFVALFRQIDPSNRLREHRLYFHVVYSQDEEELMVVNVVYVQRSH
jgi:hypothetical protein